MQSGIDIFVLISGSFSIVATVPLIYLAIRSVRDAREVRRVQFEVADLMEEVHEIQREIITTSGQPRPRSSRRRRTSSGSSGPQSVGGCRASGWSSAAPVRTAEAVGAR